MDSGRSAIYIEAQSSWSSAPWLVQNNPDKLFRTAVPHGNEGHQKKGNGQNGWINAVVVTYPESTRHSITVQRKQVIHLNGSQYSSANAHSAQRWGTFDNASKWGSECSTADKTEGKMPMGIFRWSGRSTVYENYILSQITQINKIILILYGTWYYTSIIF